MHRLWRARSARVRCATRVHVVSGAIATPTGSALSSLRLSPRDRLPAGPAMPGVPGLAGFPALRPVWRGSGATRRRHRARTKVRGLAGARMGDGEAHGPVLAPPPERSDPGRRRPRPDVSRTSTRQRIRPRGGTLAVALSERANLPCVRALSRASGGRTQVSLHPQQRLANVKNAFSLREQALNRLRGADVVLVDDVLTTGATARAAAEELNGAGVRGVTLITYSRALPGGRSAQGPRPASPTRA